MLSLREWPRSNFLLAHLLTTCQPRTVMTRRIKRIGPLQAGKMLGILYACMGLIFLPFFLVIATLGSFAQQHAQPNAPPPALIAGIFFGMGIFAPVIYGVMGFVFGAVGAALYNLVARWIGGLEFEIE